jgi:hypothetical protein
VFWAAGHLAMVGPFGTVVQRQLTGESLPEIAVTLPDTRPTE